MLKCLYIQVHRCLSLYNLLCLCTHTTDKHIDKLVKSGIIIGFIKYSFFALYFDYIILFWAEELLYMQGEMQNLKIN